MPGVPWIAEHQATELLESRPVPLEQDAERPLVTTPGSIQQHPFVSVAEACHSLVNRDGSPHLIGGSRRAAAGRSRECPRRAGRSRREWRSGCHVVETEHHSSVVAAGRAEALERLRAVSRCLDGAAPRRRDYGEYVTELMFPTPALRDAVVLLRPWRETDVPWQLETFSDPWFQRFSDWAPRAEHEARRHLVEHEQARRRGEQLQFAVVEPSDDELILGGASLHDVELDQGRAAVGYWLAAGARGRGVATHAVRLLARWAFDDLGLARVALTCAPNNHASQRVAERCGFSREGVLRSHMPFKGARRDTVVFGVLPGELR